MSRCREKLAELEYLKWDANADSLHAFLEGRRWQIVDREAGLLAIENASGRKTFVRPGNYMLKGEADDIFVATPEVFAKAYEAI